MTSYNVQYSVRNPFLPTMVSGVWGVGGPVARACVGTDSFSHTVNSMSSMQTSLGFLLHGFVSMPSPKGWCRHAAPTAAAFQQKIECWNPPCKEVIPDRWKKVHDCDRPAKWRELLDDEDCRIYNLNREEFDSGPGGAPSRRPSCSSCIRSTATTCRGTRCRPSGTRASPTLQLRAA